MGFGGFLKGLGKIGAGIAAPFTGGASLGLIPAIDAIGGVLGGAAKGSADQRISEVPGQIGAYRANLEGQQFNADEQDRGYRRAALSSLLGNVQDASIGRPENSTIPTFNVSGGLRPSAITGGGGREALMALLSQPGFHADAMELPKAGLGEKIMGGIGLGANILGALGGARSGQQYLQQAGMGSQIPGGNVPPPPGHPDWRKYASHDPSGTWGVG